jgi:RNA polymerase sigma factor (TIGR02999 family)
MNDQAPIPPSPASPQPATQLLPQVYEELRRLAAWRLATEPAGQTLQPTALVHEAWLRLHAGAPAVWANRAHFFAAAAEAMRRILIDNARRKQAIRHGGGLHRTALELDALAIGSETPDDELLAVHEALDALAAHDARKAELVKLRYFAGLTLEETAAALDLSERTAKRDWAYARAWLFREIARRKHQAESRGAN